MIPTEEKLEFDSLLNITGGEEFFENVLGGLTKIDNDSYSIPSDISDSSDTSSESNDSYYHIKSDDEEILFNSDAESITSNSEEIISEEPISIFIETEQEIVKKDQTLDEEKEDDNKEDLRQISNDKHQISDEEPQEISEKTTKSPLVIYESEEDIKSVILDIINKI